MKKLLVTAVAVLVVGVAMVPFVQAKAISSKTALNRTFHYAKVQCYDDHYCKAYAASLCRHHNRGVSCWAWNYERRGHKYTCKRLVFWRGYQRQFLSSWKCDFNGWNWGPGLPK